jgi:hypothetical protein
VEPTAKAVALQGPAELVRLRLHAENAAEAAGPRTERREDLK